MDKQKVTQIDYTNWRGERRVREIFPTGHLEFSNTEYHPETQWLLEAVDVEDGKVKLFALKDIHRFGLTEPASPWRDIESAPRDGTPILCVKQGSGFHPEILGFEGGVFGWLNEDWSFSYNPDNQPTHWMPLQEPPR